jgi:UDPglucose 6-dehydrogenase
MKIAVIGTGYVGLVAGVCFATHHEVTCVDLSEEKVKTLQAGKTPIYEPGLEGLLKANARRLTFTTNLASAVRDAKVVFIAVGTPEGEDGSADLQYVLKAAEQIGNAITGYTVVVNKSTVPVGTAALVRDTIAQVTQVPFDVVSNPEFLREGNAIQDFIHPDRVVIGTESSQAADLMTGLYQDFTTKIIVMRTKSAEVTKYAGNSMLATRISFMNEIANFCDRVGADVKDVARGIGADARIGPHFLHAGIGYGGSCFPKDVLALMQSGTTVGLRFPLLRAVEEVNDHQRYVLVNKAFAHFGNLKDLRVAVWGLSFKPDTDDVRESPAITLIHQLLQEGAIVTCYDPVAMDAARKVLGEKVTYAQSAKDALTDAQALFLATEWKAFGEINEFELAETLGDGKAVFDGRNFLKGDRLRRVGLAYYGIGTL